MTSAKCCCEDSNTDTDSYPKLPNALLVRNLFSLNAFLTRTNAALFSGKMTQPQRLGCERYIVAYFILSFKGMDIPLSYLAYTLATVYHETGYKMQPVEEVGKGAGYEYGKPDPDTGQTYYGRGDVQVTWRYNYETIGAALIDLKTLKKSFDLLNYPDLLLEPVYSSQATLIGMSRGIFTGKSYADYLDQEEPDYINARRIINGVDRAETIAGYAKEFERALRLGFGAPLDRDTLQVGSKGTDTTELQLNLNVFSDGIFGHGTQTAVIEFQQNNGLTADGIVGYRTWQKVEQVFY